MNYSIEFVRNILKLSEENRQSFNQFLFDICEYFPNNFDEYNKIIIQFGNGKRQFLNRRYNDFVKKNRSILGIFTESNVPKNLIFTIDSYKETLKFVEYIMKNINNNDKIYACLNSLENLGIESFNFVDDLPFALTISETKDGNYHLLYGAYTDGKNTVECAKQRCFTTDYIVDCSSANYIIYYSKDNIDGLKDINVYVGNLEFDPNTLPKYNKLHGKNNWQTLNKGKRKCFQK